MSGLETEGARRILVVDDSEDDRIHVRRLLRDASRAFRIDEVESGEAGLAAVTARPYDLVLLDYYLPDMSGADFIDRLPPDRRAVPITVLTGVEDPQVAVDVLKRGGIDYLVKGTMSGAGLGRAIENAIERHAVQRELEEKRAVLELRNWELEALREELQQRLVELASAYSAKDQFLAVMSHEMRTPLNAILGYADLLELRTSGELSEGQSVYVERIRIGGRHLLDLINDVLDLSRADASKIELDLRPVDLGAVVEEVTELLESQATAGGLELHVRTCEDAPLVEGDLQRLRQILTNLIGNAIKFTPSGRVEVECGVSPKAPDRVFVRVHDTGIGIAPDLLPKVFTEFFQAEGELTREYGGSGLGLAIAQRFARLMGGEVEVESIPGDGSTFTLTLRRASEGSERRASDVEEQEARMERQRAHRAPSGVDREHATVVAFGEDRDALEALATHVSEVVEFVWTTQAAEVPALAARERAALVVLDISSGRDEAWEAAHNLQEIPELAHTAVLLLPGIPAADPEARGGMDLGWISLVPKPFTGEQLTRAVLRAAQGTRPDGEPAEIGRNLYNVLVVDDDIDSRRVAAKFLGDAGATVHEAVDGETALVKMRRSVPDVVVLDLMMPVLDGFGVLATMRADPRLARIPVVVLSAKTLSAAEREFLSRTAIRVLQKGEHRLTDVAALVLRAAVGAVDSIERRGDS